MDTKRMREICDALNTLEPVSWPNASQRNRIAVLEEAVWLLLQAALGAGVEGPPGLVQSGSGLGA